MTKELNLKEKREELRESCEDSRVIPSKHTRETISLLLDSIEKQDKKFIRLLKDDFEFSLEDCDNGCDGIVKSIINKQSGYKSE